MDSRKIRQTDAAMRAILAFLFLSIMLIVAPGENGQQVHSSLSDQKVCADQAKKFFKETDYSDDSKHPLKNEFTSHYDASKKVCYVRIDYTIRTPGTKGITTSSYAWDAFEGRNLATYVWASQEGKKYWEVKPIECWTKLIGGTKASCSTTEDFEVAVEKSFGLGE
jgi:hypothetical protein